jgi:recombinational DNA repair protein (RecF pathway)
MSYTIFTTDSFIVKALPTRDADVTLLLFTEQFGLVHAVAKSARQTRSKLRPALQSLSFSSISLVKGREVWRVTSAKKHISLHDKRLPIIYKSMFARMLLFIDRFCPRETAESQVFANLKEISGFIFKREADKKTAGMTSTDIIESIELLFALKTLFELGYVTMVPEIEDCLKKSISEEIIQSLEEPALRKKIKQNIEKGMAESHL